ncbi:MAG: hypothetical protein JWM16_2726 [Verrucomicrobiales bacterium]|nr:hypothetical protein [Verrucomicrobiales bacterium]
MDQIAHFVVLLSLCAGILNAEAGPVSSGSSSTNAIPAFPADKPPLKKIAPGIFELGKVRLDKNQRTISFPALLNMKEALAEYLVVNTAGKTHESLLRTEAEPWHVHVAMLLLGAKGTQGNPFPENKSKPLPGDPVRIELRWAEKGSRLACQAEDCILDVHTTKTMSRGNWIFVGSRFEEGVFKAQQDGSIISLIEDPDALVNNPRVGRDNDDNWRIKTEGLPPLDTLVEVVIHLE